MSVQDVLTKYNCTYCQEVLVTIGVKCAECTDFVICLQCFSVGAEIGPHRNNHSYQFLDLGTSGIYNGRNCWKASEEVRLLEGLEQFGFGNWEDIAKHIESKTPEEAKDEYIARFLEGNIGRATWGKIEGTSRPSLHCGGRDEGPLGPDAMSRLNELVISPDEASQLGYMKYRDDFEREHDHEAEQIISTLSLNPEDDDLDIGLKLSQIDIYTRRLRERTRRKRLMRDYQLVRVFFNNQKNKQKPFTKLEKEKKDFMERLRWTSQLYLCAEQGAVLAGLWRERELRVRMAELHRYRLAGLTRLEECAHYEQHAAHRKHPHGSSGYLDNNLTKEQTPNQQSLKRRDGESALNSTSPKSTRDGNIACGCCKNSLCSGNCSKHLLNNNEIQLCTTLNMPPAQYITLKGVLLRKPATPDSEIDHALKHYFHSAGWIRK